MRIQCPNCPAAYELDDGRVPPAGLSIKCPKCKTPFTVQRPKPGEGKAAGQKVPLPGTGAPSAPAAKPWTPRAAAPGKPQGPKGAVPLPGMQGFGGATRSEEHTSELQSLAYLVCRLLLEKKKKKTRE